MSTSGHDRYYGSISKSRRGSPGESQSGFFQGQGGRTVLPPLSSAFPTSHFPVPTSHAQYTQPRSSPGRYDFNQQTLDYEWPNAIQPATSYANYEAHPQTHYTAYPSRSPALPEGQLDSRKLPPLATSPTPNLDRWQATTPSYITTSSIHGSGAIRSPTTAYPTAYTPYPTSTHGGSYTYHISSHGQDQMQSIAMNSQTTTFEGIPDASRNDQRSTLPYRSTSYVSPPAYSPPPLSPTSTEESTVKKKRKRADAAQLKVLNETYNRTAFPSTEERHALAKALDMSARSVQIWFQNKRQAMRQTNRQSAATSNSQNYTGQAQSASLEDPERTNIYSSPVSLADSPYASRHSSDPSRAHSIQSSNSDRRIRSQDDATKWPRGY